MNKTIPCMHDDCVYCNNNECRFAFVKDRKPTIEMGFCTDYACENPLKAFIWNEVPFRIKEIHNVSDVPIAVVDAIRHELNDNSDEMFDYDKLDAFIEEQLLENGIEVDE